MITLQEYNEIALISIYGIYADAVGLLSVMISHANVYFCAWRFLFG